MKTKLLVSCLLFSAACIVIINSCNKEPDTYLAGDSKYNKVRVTVSGIVLDETNTPLSGVTISGYGQTASTDQHGTFVLRNLNTNKDRCVLQFTKAGFFNRSHGFIASVNTMNYVRIILISNTASQNFSAAAGGTISLKDNSSVTFPPNALIDASSGIPYSGIVNIAIRHLSPDDPGFGFTIPGGDLLGKNLNDENVALFTYGMLGIELTGSSGERLQLAQNQTATLSFAIASSQLATSPASVPLWFFDDLTSLWKEEGSATKQGNSYVGTVQHFSWWNCDIGTYSPLIKGKVTDCNGIPVANCVVTANGWATTVTNQNGEWQGKVPAGMPITAQVLNYNNISSIVNSQLENIPPLSNNQVFMVPDLIIPCATRIAGNLQTCPGENIDGLVWITNGSNFNTFQYTINSEFSVPVHPNVQYDVYAYYGSKFFQTTVTSPSTPTVLNLENIHICDSSADTIPLGDSIPENCISLTCPAFGIQDSIVSYVNAANYGLTEPWSNYSLVWIGNTAYTNHLEMHVAGVTSGTYQWSYNGWTTLLGNFFPGGGMGIFYYIHTPADSGTIEITIGNVGETIFGHFEGNITVKKAGVNMPGYIKCNFNVPRTQ